MNIMLPSSMSTIIYKEFSGVYFVIK